MKKKIKEIQSQQSFQIHLTKAQAKTLVKLAGVESPQKTLTMIVKTHLGNIALLQKGMAKKPAPCYESEEHKQMVARLQVLKFDDNETPGN